MITEKIRQLSAARAKVAELEAQIAADVPRELAALPARYGFGDMASFMTALKGAVGRSRRRRSAAKPAKSGGHRRAKITDATRAEARKLVAQGKTGKEIARELGISLASVQNLKRALGLVKRRK